MYIEGESLKDDIVCNVAQQQVILKAQDLLNRVSHPVIFFDAARHAVTLIFLILTQMCLEGFGVLSSFTGNVANVFDETRVFVCR